MSLICELEISISLKMQIHEIYCGDIVETRRVQVEVNSSLKDSLVNIFATGIDLRNKCIFDFLFILRMGLIKLEISRNHSVVFPSSSSSATSSHHKFSDAGCFAH